MRKLVAGFAALGLMAAGLTGGASAAEGVLRMLMWDGYADAEWVAAFEEQTGYKVEVSYIQNSDEQIARMKASGGKDFDLVAVDGTSIKTFADQGLVQALDLSRITAYGNLLPEFQDTPIGFFDGKRYGVPFAWGSLGIVYDKKTFPEGVESWAVLWDPAYKGRVISQDNSNDNITLGAIAIGLDDPYAVSDEDYPKVQQKLIDLRGNLLTYYGSIDEGHTVWKENDVVLSYSMGEDNYRRLAKEGYEVGYAIPDEGAPGWLDSLSISAGAANIDAAYAWINFVTDPAIGEHLATKYGFGSTTSRVGDLNYSDKLIWIRPPESLPKRQEVFNEVRSGAQ
jgi:putative spermidine/putrescine transport system substrate-binding protein